ncbi:peroxiredoxin [Ralstonia pseudosolanacearum]|uniref:peroxiredoxin n=1 Tax=Ralstonia pseudosolanacearum TaxID=1310165 RepID=UPI0007D7BF43|nr:peroxiredoxin [Ralstonia pseudosolanacearum]MDC6293317.1 peroxiredoxin [Ralstonia pseudosolanacearum]MDD7788558.1 peroxiredoxin [Ralstonia pseudosolanacearum]MDN3366016.1 peroxiredoxin [Ralstonia pseudosolanacearum]OAK92008.1 alkyl hydroperoxide reductase [Ralstonia pseudosolanacearum]QOK86822.1 peroxiredoxin [Ralstonia pseudosolanacearum]
MPVTLDQPLPDFSAPATSGLTFSLAGQRGKVVVLYFYPKDNTPGCTTEAMNFRDHYDAFEAADAVVFGISRDSLKSHENFKAKLELPFELLSDADEAVCALFDTIKMKKMYGKDVRGIERSTFLIDRKGVLRQEWRGVKVPNHVDEVLGAVRAL